MTDKFYYQINEEGDSSIPERDVEGDTVTYAEDNGVQVILKLNGPGDKGKPDRFFMHKGSVLVIEMKRFGQKPTALQYSWLESFSVAGAEAFWVDDSAAGMDLIDNLLDENDGL